MLISVRIRLEGKTLQPAKVVLVKGLTSMKGTEGKFMEERD